MKYSTITFHQFKNFITGAKAARKTSLPVIALVALSVFLLLSHKVAAVNRTWDGGGATNNWSEGANWSGDTVPGSGDVAIFDGTSTKDAAIDSGFGGSVAGIEINAGYTGTITHSSAATFTVGGNGFIQSAGSFTGGINNIAINSGFTLNGGTFNAPSGTLSAASAFTVAGGATFNPNGGTVAFVVGSATSTVNLPASFTLNNIIINKPGNLLQFNSTSTMIAAGSLTLTDGFMSDNFGMGTIEAQGPVSIAATFDGGDSSLLVSGAATRTVTLIAGAGIPRLTVNAANVTVDTSGAPGTVTFTRPVNFQSAAAIGNGAVNFTFNDTLALSTNFTQGSGGLNLNNAYTQTAGIFTAGSGALNFNLNFTLGGGTFNAPSGTLSTASAFTVAGGATFNPNGGTVAFAGGSFTSTVNLPASFTLNNIIINKPGNLLLFNSTSTMIAAGSLTLTDGFMSDNFGLGTIEAQGLVTIAATFDGGNSTLLVSGAATRTVTLIAGAGIPRLTVNAANVTVDTSGAPGTVTFTQPVNFQSAVAIGNGAVNFTFNNTLALSTNFTQGSGGLNLNNAYTQTAGIFTAGSGALNFNLNFTLGGGTFNAPSGTLSTASAFTVAGGATFNPNGGTVAFVGGSLTSAVNLPASFTLNNIIINKPGNLLLFNSTSTIIAAGSLTLTDGFMSDNFGLGTIEAQGLVTIAATFDGGNSSISFSGPADQTFTNNGGVNPSGTWTVNKSSGKVTLASNLTLGTSQALSITSGTLDLGPSFNLTAGAITIGPGGTLRNFGAGNLTLGGNLINNGVFNFNGGGTACGDPNGSDPMLIRSSSAGTARNWSGTGAFSIVDTDIQDQNVTAIAAGVAAFTSNNSGGNTNISFPAGCPVEVTTQPTDQAACPGDPATFTAAATGTGVTFQWRKNGINLTDGGNISGATTAALTINPAGPGDVANYDVVATNSFGVTATSAAAGLILLTPPSITSQPSSAVRCVGEPVTFSVSGMGSNISFQWRKGGVDIVGATSSSFSILSVTTGDADSYDVVVTGTCAPAATSNSVTLTVNGFALSSNSQFFPTVGGSGSVNVLTADSCSWTAVSNDGFITITGGGSGTGNGAVSFMVGSTTTPRTGTMTIAGLTFTVDQSNPTAISLISFKAEGYDNGTFLEWQTGLEVDNLGFNIYRDDGGRRTLVNNQLVAGSALRARSGLRSGDSYVWWDRSTSKDAAYWLEDVDLKGLSTWHGPFYPTQAVGKQPPARLEQAKTLAELGSGRSPSAPVEVRAAPAPASSPANDQLLIAASPDTLKLKVKREGWYRATQPELAAAGFNTSVDPRLLQFFVDGRELPMLVPGEQDGRFDAADSIEFYGVGLDSPFTESRTYWLAAGSKPGLRIKQHKGDGVPTASRSFTATIERRDRTVYFSALRNGDKENFFGAVIAFNPVDQQLMLSRVDRGYPGNAQVEIALQGVKLAAHRVGVDLNGTHIGEVIFNGQSQGTAKFIVSQSMLLEGGNIVRLTPLAGPSDVSLVDYVRVSYQHSYSADNDSLKFTAGGTEQITADGFTSKSIRVFDVTDANSPQELLGEVTRQKAGYSVTFASSGKGERALLAFAGQPRSAVVTLNQPSNLSKANASFLVITSREFAASLMPLVALREKQGMSVAVIDIEDIYDEFSFGQKTPFAVKDFLAVANSTWKKKPRFVLFAGDASYDPKNYLGFGDLDLVPARLIDTEFMETSSDDWFSDFDGDGIAELATGRLPARTAGEMWGIVVKIVNYERSGPSDEALLVADANDGFDFEQASAELRSLIPGSLRITQVNRGRLDPEMARRSLFDALYRKQFLVNYTGHGSVDLWRANLLTNDDALALGNEHLPMFVMMTCLNGYLQDPALDSLAESLLKAERGGAVAVWASSGMTFPMDQALMNQELYRQLFNPTQALTVGEAAMRAKASVSNSDIRRTWILLGDPTMRPR